MSEEKWYHGRLSRQKAEELVNKAAIDGSFVVRASESILGAYALSVLFSGAIHTYRILPMENGRLAVQTTKGVQERKFTSITELITVYRNPQNGLVCGLTNPVGPTSDKPTPPPAVTSPMSPRDIGGWLPQTPEPVRSASFQLPQSQETPQVIPRYVATPQSHPGSTMPPPSYQSPQPHRTPPVIPRSIATPQPVSTMPPPSHQSPQLQGMPPIIPRSVATAQPGSTMPPRGGVKVMLDDRKLHQILHQRERDHLPPVPPPSREPSQRPIPNAPSQILQLPSSSSGNGNFRVIEDIREKLLDRVKIIASACPSVGTAFLEQLQQYCADGARRDIDGVLNGSKQCAEMQELLAKETGPFQKQLEIFLSKIDVLRQLFDTQSTVRPLSSNFDIRDDRDVDLESFLTRLEDCKKTVKNLDKRISITIKEQAGMEVESLYGTALRSSSTRSSIPEYNFEVKAEGQLKQTRAKLQVNVNLGRLNVLKGDDVCQFNYDQVLQIIKNNKSRSKLSVLFDGGKKREYIFESSSQREAFCQVMQLVRNTHSNSTEPDFVSVFIGSWNMGDAMPPVDIRSWFRCGGGGRVLDPSVCDIPHDIYVVGTQETGLPEREWLHKVTETIAEITGESFHLVAMDALWHMKILILVKETHRNRISHVQTSSVKTGIANTLGNKGAVAIAFQFGGTSLCFINAHLTSGNEKCGRRNQNYHDIMRSLNLGLDRFSVFDLTNRFDHLCFLGDLNYRLEMDVQEILAHIKQRDLGMLYKVDQLRREKELNKVFYGYSEEEIAFPPTYRYERGTRESYSHLKIKRTGIRINVPSWCDRVLWKSYPETHNVCLAYGCSDDIMTSDHSPVFCNLQIGVRGQYVSNTGIKPTSQPATIIFEIMEAILKASGRMSFYLEFHSPCLASSVRTVSNSQYNTKEFGQNCIRIIWDNLPQLLPIISDREYLVDQHLLVLIKCEDDNDTHAEFVLALRSMIATAPQNFEEHLSRKGEDAGQIRGSMHVKTRDNVVSRKEKLYEFIQIGKREDTSSAVEPTHHGDSSATLSRDPGSLFGNVGSSIASVVSKITGGNLQGKTTPQPQQTWTRPTVDTRPPMAVDMRPPIAAPPQSQQTWTRPTVVARAPLAVDTRPPMAAPMSPPTHIQAVVYSEMPQRLPTSGESSPQRNRQMSPLFATRPPPTKAARPMADPYSPVENTGSPHDRTPSPSNLDTTRPPPIKAARPMADPHSPLAFRGSPHDRTPSPSNLDTTRPPPTKAARPMMDPHSPVASMGSPHDRTPSPSNLDAMIAEFEAAGSMFEDLSLGCESETTQQVSVDWQQAQSQQSYEYSGRSVDTKRALPPLGGATPPPPNYTAPSRYASSPPAHLRTVIGQSTPPFVQSRTVIGQASAPPIQARSVIGQSSAPILPPPQGPAPQLFYRKKRVRIQGCPGPLVSVQELMGRLGLSQYTEEMLENGWDSLEFLSDLTEDDLIDCGIVNEGHRMAILSCVEHMEWME